MGGRGGWKGEFFRFRQKSSCFTYLQETEFQRESRLGIQNNPSDGFCKLQAVLPQLLIFKIFIAVGCFQKMGIFMWVFHLCDFVSADLNGKKNSCENNMAFAKPLLCWL